MSVIIRMMMLFAWAIAIASNGLVHSAPELLGQLEMPDHHFDNSPRYQLSSYFIRERALRRKEIPKSGRVARIRRSPEEKVDSTSTASPQTEFNFKNALITMIQEFQMMRHEINDLKQTVAELRSSASWQSKQHKQAEPDKCTQQHYHLHYFPLHLYPSSNGSKVEADSTIAMNVLTEKQLQALRHLADIPSKPLAVPPLGGNNKNEAKMDKVISKGMTTLVSIISTGNQQTSGPKFPPVEVEDMIMASCRIKSNRHIALLNQQDIEGVIKLWQRRSKPGPVYMQVRLRGFKTENQNCLMDGNSTCYKTYKTDADSGINGTEANSDTQQFGIHVHEFGDLSRDCQSTGNHFNPFHMEHGGPNDKVKHLGDLGNIHSSSNGTVSENLTFEHLSMVGEHSIIDRSIVIRNQADDYGRNPNSASKTVGNSGARIACCKISQVVDTTNFGDFTN